MEPVPIFRESSAVVLAVGVLRCRGGRLGGNRNIIGVEGVIVTADRQAVKQERDVESPLT